MERPSALVLGVLVDRWDEPTKEAEAAELSSAEVVENLAVATPGIATIVGQLRVVEAHVHLRIFATGRSGAGT